MNEFMKLAIDEANNGIENSEGGPFGCIIVKDDKIVGRGHNQVLLNLDPTCHGEMQAIRNACSNLKTFDLSGCILYTTGEPCIMCMGAILWANIEKVYYGCTIDDAEYIGFRDKKFDNMTNAEKKRFSVKLDRKECLELFEKYKEIEEKTMY